MIETSQDLQPPLVGDTYEEEVAVGGGFANLTSALVLYQAGMEVIMLKMDYCGMGASGRSVGHLTQTIGKDFPNLIKLYGKERGVRTACIADRKVDCDLEAFAS